MTKSVSTQSSMLQLFRQGASSYQPEGLAFEDGTPKTAYANISRLRQTGLMISQIHVRPTGTLFQFSTGEQYYTPALRLGVVGPETEILAEIASEAGWGDLDELLEVCQTTAANYVGVLPDMSPDRLDVADCPRPDCPLKQR